MFKTNKETDSSGERTWFVFFLFINALLCVFFEAFEFQNKNFCIFYKNKKVFLEKETKEGDSPVQMLLFFSIEKRIFL